MAKAYILHVYKEKWSQNWWVRMHFDCIISIFEDFHDKKKIKIIEVMEVSLTLDVKSEQLNFEHKIAPGIR